MKKPRHLFQEMVELFPNEVDLTDEEHSEIIVKTVDFIIGNGYSVSDIENVEDEFIDSSIDSNIFLLLALKIAKSKIAVSNVTEPLQISVIFAVYKEHNRILHRTNHPHGEDFLLRKVEQLQWLFEGQTNIDWEMVIVDDGCPEESGKIAQNIIDQNDLNSHVRVLHLSDAIEQNLPPARGLSSTKESQKGGAILYGLWDAVCHQKNENHIVIYTDADLSTHLGQVMLLAEPLLKQDRLAAIGSRRKPKSVVIKNESRNNRGKLFIYLWKRLIPDLGDIIDTQCGFKAFKAGTIKHIIDDLLEKKFAFDIELLLKTALHKKDAIASIPIAWIDSEEASTTTDLQPYLPMLKSIAKMNRKYLRPSKESAEFVRFIESLDDIKFSKMLNNIPQNIVDREPLDFIEYNQVRVSDLM